MTAIPVSKQGTITLPPEIRRGLGLDSAAHPMMLVELRDGGVFLQPAEAQAVRLPKEFRFGGTEVCVARMGSAVVLLPPHRTWDILFEACEGASEDFMKDREQPPTQQREL